MAPTKIAAEAEWKTRKLRIDPRLDGAGWPKRQAPPQVKPFRTEEHETTNGPADYALWIDSRVVAVVEAKKVTVGPQNVLTQAERYARGIDPAQALGNWGGLRAPFLYATSGEVTWFHDVRHPLNRSRRVAGFHTESMPTEAELAGAEGRGYETAEELLARVRGEAAKDTAAPKRAGKVPGTRKRQQAKQE